MKSGAEIVEGIKEDFAKFKAEEEDGIMGKFHWIWHLEKDQIGTMPPEVPAHLESEGFKRVHECSDEHGEFVAYANGKTKVAEICDFCDEWFDYTPFTSHLKLVPRGG